ncbi:hypothetical protein K450DRAFT_220351 [Umbelopsis ramanniana AG]|uniref:Uncharacterized protein n=1 Tax=Umbelopsis ramanniana AG TaxID=1314678 RepID=A0AAD5EJ71_UMBRA|nr:uncharacterized protein K450DRAFT_220351 [Umbelopsis ramanniana AG]KAI8583871.1 hypothetical protein K450DRAFT_220351 [Umbelopsis ramanniana AG]
MSIPWVVRPLHFLRKRPKSFVFTLHRPFHALTFISALLWGSISITWCYPFRAPSSTSLVNFRGQTPIQVTKYAVIHSFPWFMAFFCFFLPNEQRKVLWLKNSQTWRLSISSLIFSERPQFEFFPRVCHTNSECL